MFPGILFCAFNVFNMRKRYPKLGIKLYNFFVLNRDDKYLYGLYGIRFFICIEYVVFH